MRLDTSWLGSLRSTRSILAVADSSYVHHDHGQRCDRVRQECHFPSCRKSAESAVDVACAYCSSVTFSSHSTFLPPSSSWIAMCVMRLVCDAPCQCFTPGGIRTTSPARNSSIGPPHCRTRPVPAVTISTCPTGWVCQAVRAPGSKVTEEADEREGSSAENSGSMRAEPVKYSAGPTRDGCEPLRMIRIVGESSLDAALIVSASGRGASPA